MTVATKRKIILSGLLGIVSAGVISATGYAATPPSWIQKMSKPVLHQTLGKAIEHDDYTAFAQALEGKPGARQITQTQFKALVTAYTLHKAGKDSAAQAQLQSAGLTSQKQA